MEPYEEALCPCESGKRYIECCLDLHIAKSRRNPTEEMQAELKKAMAGKSLANLEEANRFLRIFNDRRNSEPRADFLGLSSNQVFQMINLPFTGELPIVRRNNDFPVADLEGIPVVADVRKFLEALSRFAPLKATATGNLPRGFAENLFQEIDHSKWKKFIKFRSEMDSPKVNVLRLLLEMSGWIKKIQGTFSLTLKGKKVLDGGFLPASYIELFDSYVSRFNWAYLDRNEELEIIQRAWLFSLYLLHKRARSWTDNFSISPSFIRAFPLVLADIRHPWTNVFRIVDRCYTWRFLEYFGSYFGLIDVQDRPEPLNPILAFKSSAFFDHLFTWRSIGSPVKVVH
jgi:hypothetical protein